MSSNKEAPIEVPTVSSTFEDDEEIVANINVSEEKAPSFTVGTAEATVINKTEAPLEQTKFNVLLELKGKGLSEDRPGLDLVAVLDISLSMKEDKRLQKLQRAMQFLIRKLSPIDRLSIVAFCNVAARYCPLRQVTEDSQPQIESIVKGFVAGGTTDIPAGVYQALLVIERRRYKQGRTAAIMVMSDGKTDDGTEGQISQLQMKQVPVFTFGFGTDQDSRVLNKIASGSKGGTYSDVQNTENLGLAFSQCLAGLLTLVVEDLTLTVTPLPLTVPDPPRPPTVPEIRPTVIENVNTGYYPRPKDLNVGESVTVSFGDLYDQEVRKVLVELVLPKAESRTGMDFLQISHTYKSKGRLLKAAPIVASVVRVKKSTEKEKDEVIVELKRLRAARKIKKAVELADKRSLDKAREELVNMQRELDNTALSGPDNTLLDMLKSELKQLLAFMIDQTTYENLGRPFALSALTSHALQRYATRGDIEELRLFATQRMNEYLEQAKLFDKNRNMILSNSVEDLKNDIIKKTLLPDKPIKPSPTPYSDEMVVALKLITTAVVAAVLAAVISAIIAAI